MKVLVTGGKGQLGQELVANIGLNHDVIGLGSDKLDVCNLAQCLDIMHKHQPDTIIHAAAYTAVDLAELNTDRAFAVNAFGSRNMAIAAERVKAKLCYISTDYVFDGLASLPYKEYDQTNPLSVYGKSKRAGEQLVQSLSSRYFIVRTSWVYGQYGTNFVKTMLKLGKEKPCLQVVDDQVGSPTYSLDLCSFLEQLISTDFYGIYHASNTGSCSWYEFAKAIFAEIGYQTKVEPCQTGNNLQSAPRPLYSVMDHLSIRANQFAEFRPWREALHGFIEQFCK